MGFGMNEHTSPNESPIEDWIPCACCGYRERVDVCLLDGTTERDFEHAFKCVDCLEECKDAGLCVFREVRQ